MSDVICPRECPSPKTDHCVGPVENGKARCRFCGKYMPLDEAIDMPWEWEE